MDSIEHITTLINDIPSWLSILEEQKDQIGRRQVELARLDQPSTAQGPSARSLRNKGSTESLRPKMNDRLDEEAEQAVASDDHNEDATMGQGSKKDSFLPVDILGSSSTPKAQPKNTPSSPRFLKRKGSGSKKVPPSGSLKASPGPPTHTTQLLKRRKSRTSSIHSMHSSNSINLKPPSHSARLIQFVNSNRTKTAITVYYDKHVQDAFENLVRHISTARNAMRKGKMAERMGNMKRLAELEDGSSEEEERLPMNPNAPILNIRTNTLIADLRSASNQNISATSAVGNPGAGLGLFQGNLEAIEADDPENDETLPEQATLQFKSTRMMGPGRVAASAVPSTPPSNVNEVVSFPAWFTGNKEDSIYDALDRLLELCQSICEGAAHRFLRDGECYTEIADVRKRLEQLVRIAQREVSRVEVESTKVSNRGGGSNVGMRGGGLSRGTFPSMRMHGDLDQGRARAMRTPLMRKSPTPTRTYSAPNALEAEGSPSTATAATKTKAPAIEEGLYVALEVDDDEDEGLCMDADGERPQLIFRSSRAGCVIRR